LYLLGSFGQYGVTGMLQACTYVFFAYVGFDSVATVAQEAKTPTARSIPFATIASVIISLLIYIGISTVMVGLVSYKLLDSDNPLSVAM
jgi:APA family basic amino acid/polyamine antiporter